MKIYEMILSLGIIEEPTKITYSENSKINRKDFLLKMAHIIEDELKNLKKTEKDIEIINFFEPMYQEILKNLEAMSSSFIKYGVAKLNEYIFLSIEERSTADFG